MFSAWCVLRKMYAKNILFASIASRGSSETDAVTNPATSLSVDDLPTFSAPFLISPTHLAIKPGAQRPDSSTQSPIPPPSRPLGGRPAANYILFDRHG